MTPERIRPLVALVLALLVTAPAPAGAADAPVADAAARAARRSPVVEVFERTRDAVVNISSTEIITARRPSAFDRLFDDFFVMPSRPRQYARQSVGSGFVIHADGYIVTNAHVVAPTAERRVTFADGREYDARIIARDEQRDLAVLKIDAEQPLATLPLGRSDDLMIGETAIAIGNPLGYQHTVTAGVVSAVDRDLAASGHNGLQGLIQTDASINPGNSGGPLLNVLGELIGVNTAIRGDAQNIGFAIPVDQLREVLPELLDVHRRQRIETGLTIGGFHPPEVVAVAPDSPAARAGVRSGDRLIGIDAAAVREPIDFHIGLLGRHAGERVRLRLRRGERDLDCELILAERPQPDGFRLARERLGLVVESLPHDLALQLGLPNHAGLLVGTVERGGPAAGIGIERSDILLGLGRYSISTPEELGQLLEQTKPGDELPIAILRIDRRGKARMSGVITVR